MARTRSLWWGIGSGRVGRVADWGSNEGASRTLQVERITTHTALLICPSTLILAAKFAFKPVHPGLPAVQIGRFKSRPGQRRQGAQIKWTRLTSRSRVGGQSRLACRPDEVKGWVGLSCTPCHVDAAPTGEIRALAAFQQRRRQETRAGLMGKSANYTACFSEAVRY